MEIKVGNFFRFTSIMRAPRYSLYGQIVYIGRNSIKMRLPSGKSWWTTKKYLIGQISRGEYILECLE